ncbi:hypothetical protein J4729_13730 [Leisingera sp. HS039]|nr:hypothetical protein [Leisingera sp. HS039]
MISSARWQRLQGGPVRLFEQLPAAGDKVAGDLAAEPVQQRADGGVYFLEAEELQAVQPRQDPAFDQQDSTLGLRFVFWFARPRGQ